MLCLLRGEVLAGPPHHRGDLQLEVEAGATWGDRHIVVRAHDRVRVAEVEQRLLVPDVGDRAVATESADPFHVLGEGDEVADAGRLWQRRLEPRLSDGHDLAGVAARRLAGGVEALAVVAE
jgi:hypothetical protein